MALFLLPALNHPWVQVSHVLIVVHEELVFFFIVVELFIEVESFSVFSALLCNPPEVVVIG